MNTKYSASMNTKVTYQKSNNLQLWKHPILQWGHNNSYNFSVLRSRTRQCCSTDMQSQMNYMGVLSVYVWYLPVAYPHSTDVSPKILW